MPATLTLNTFLHNASLLLHAYPTSRITTKYSLPRKAKPSSSSEKEENTTTPTTTAPTKPQREKKDPSATLTLKVYHPPTGICLKYSTDKSQEVGRLITSLGKLARGEKIDLPAVTPAGVEGEGGSGDKMEVDSGPQVAVKERDGVVAGKPSGQGSQQQQGGGGGGGGGKKKKGKGKR